MNLNIEGRVALVLGASSGLGRAIARALMSEGVHVAAAGRKRETLQEFTQAQERGVRGMAVQWDLSDLRDITRVVSEVEDKLGAVDILVNNTGGPPPAVAQGIATEVWMAQFEQMVLSVIALTDRIVGRMRERGWGRIITTTSSGVQAPIPGLALSNSLRLCLVGWSKTLALEVAKDGVTVNVIAPGRIDTARVRALDASRAQREGRSIEWVRAASEASIPAGRYGTPEEYASAVTFLASAQASYITGTVLRVDGGMIPSI